MSFSPRGQVCLKESRAIVSGVYLNQVLVESSFKRLSPRKDIGKTALERTSALMYFLAFDAAVNKNGSSPLNLEPKNFEGETNRKTIVLEFVRLVLLKPSKTGKTRQVYILGKIENDGTPPEKRISSNFLTVPLKEASQASKAFLYPRRPPAPVLKMGPVATGLPWGIGYSDSWQESLPKILSETKSNSPFTDLAIFILRDSTFKSENPNFIDCLIENLGNRFTEGLVSFWAKRIKAEKTFAKHTSSPYQSSPPCALVGNDPVDNTRQDLLLSFDQEELVKRILYLEKILESKNIEY